jgi:UDP-sulfoquinovose synthase
MFQYYNKNDGIRITDLHQGIVWGTATPQTRRDERLVNSFAYDGDMGTVLNRFLAEAAIGHPLTVHGTGQQKRAFINIYDSAKCIQLALENPPLKGEKVKIFNQMTETHRIIELAEKVSALTGSEIHHVFNPRNEASENELIVDNKCLLDLGLVPITLNDGLLTESVETAKRYSHRINTNFIPCKSAWNNQITDNMH